MTANQIAYQTLLETQRANQAKEAENIRHNTASDYASLIKALNNPFSLGAHFAQGDSSFRDGVGNQFSSIFGTSQDHQFEQIGAQNILNSAFDTNFTPRSNEFLKTGANKIAESIFGAFKNVAEPIISIFK